MLTYVAAPYSHSDAGVVQRRMQIFYGKMLTMLHDGHVVVSPLQNHPLVSIGNLPSDWTYWRQYSETLLLKCERLIVLKLPEWELSSGVRGEVSFAKSRGIEIEYHEINEPFTSLLGSIRTVFPQVTTQVRGRPRSPYGNWWVDIVLYDGSILTIVWGPERGFGLYLPSPAKVGFEGPDEVVIGRIAATGRVIEILRQATCTNRTQ